MIIKNTKEKMLCFFCSDPAFLNGHETKAIIDQLVTFLSSDDNEAKCEQECHTLIRNQQSVVQHLCPFLCHSLVNLELLNPKHNIWIQTKIIFKANENYSFQNDRNIELIYSIGFRVQNIILFKCIKD